MKQKKYTNKKFAFFFFLVFLLFTILGLATDANLPFANAKTVQKNQAATSVPVIYPRSAWSSAQDEKRTKKIWPTDFENPQIIIVHHTATSYSGATSKQIKKIYRYHSYTRKWGDIGYNYIIGQDGSIFEGRYGGNGAIGGHSYYNKTNYNAGSIGIAILGDYQKKAVTPQSLDALEKLVGWLAANNGFAVTESIDFHGKKFNSRMVGHKDVASTACPGKNLYSQFSGIKSAAQNFSAAYKNYAYRMAGDGAAYEIANGKRYSGSVKTAVVDISAEQLKAYALEGEAKTASSAVGNYTYPSGTLLEVVATGQKGVLQEGVIYPTASATVLNLSYKSSNFVKISAEKWSSYPSGSSAVFRSGTLVKDENGSHYFIEAGQKRLLNLLPSDMQSIDSSKVTSVPLSELADYPDGAPVVSPNEFPAGTIITNNGKKYFMIVSAGTKKEISPNVFKAGFDGSTAVRVGKSLSQKYKNAGNLQYQNGSVIDYRGKYFFIENGKRRPFTSKSLAKAMGFGNIVKAKRKDMSQIPDGAKIE